MKDIAEEAQLLDKPGGTQLRLRFRGPFEGNEVTWNARLITLDTWQKMHPDTSIRQNFIDIGEKTAEGIAITVGLQVECIDLPTVRKTMMMVRQYKRLRPGCHLYGPPI
jgi:hypothetical protein